MYLKSILYKLNRNLESCKWKGSHKPSKYTVWRCTKSVLTTNPFVTTLFIYPVYLSHHHTACFVETEMKCFLWNQLRCLVLNLMASILSNCFPFTGYSKLGNIPCSMARRRIYSALVRAWVYLYQQNLLDPKKSLAEHISVTAQPSTWPFSDHTLQMHIVIMWVSVQTLSQQGLKWTNQKPIFLGDSQMSQH